MPWLYSRSLAGQQNSLAPPQITPPDDSGTDQGAALGQTWQAVSDYLAKQRAQSAEMGLWDDQAGRPTAKGLLDAAQQTAQGVMMGTTAPGEVAPGFTAYHGSPYSFDRFDTSKIGTGEGAQAYGHGLYFAENEGVARSYRDTLSGGTLTYDGGPLGTPGGVSLDGSIKARINQGMTPQDALKDTLGTMRHMGKGSFVDEAERAWSNPDLLRYEKNPGSMYEVNIAADPAHFLDWDKPLSEQSQHVQDALAKLEPNLYHPSSGDYDPREPGYMAYNRLGHSRDPVAVSQALRDAGIPGIRYLDQGSRGAGDGTSNHVIFDANTLAILRKYGIAGLMAGGAAAGSQQPQQ